MPAGSSSQLSLHSLITLAVNLPLSLVIKSILATILLSCLPSPFSLSNSLPKWSPTLTTFSISSSLSPPSTLSHAFSLPSWSRSNTSNVPLHHSSIIDSSHSLSSDGVGVSSQSAPSLQHHQVASTHDRAPSNPSTPLQHKHVDTPIADFEHLLQRIHTISRRKLCTLSYTSPLLGQSAVMPSASNAPASSPSSASMASVSSVPSMSSSSSSFFHHQMVTIPMSSSMADYVGHSFTSNEPCRRTQKCIDLLANVLSGYDPTTDDYQLLMETVRSTAMVENNIYRLSIAWTIKDPSDESLSPGKPLRLRFHMCTRARRKHKPLSKQHDHSNTKHHHHHHQEKKHQHQQHSHQSSCVPYITEEDIWPNHTDTWLSDRLSKILFTKRDYTSKQSLETNSNDTSEWSNIFFDCDDSKWIIAYRALILEPLRDVVPDEDTAADSYSGDMAWFRVKGVITAHVDVTSTDINQCEDPNKPAMDLFDSATGNHSQDATFRYRVERDQRMLQHQQLATQMEIESAVERGSKVEPTKVELEMMMEIPQNSLIEQVKEQEEEVDQHDQTSMEKLPSWIVLNLYGTHKCHIENSKCEFQSGHGMFRGGYQCKCKDGFHSAVTNLGPTFNGTVVEQSFQDKNPSYDYMFYCKRCAQGCDVCVDESPCLSSYDWGFRISLLTITIFCIIFVFLLVFNIYRYRRLKVIKVASPIFLCITLIGCAIMYCETVAIFPVLDAGTCVLTKWTRNFGFCITYSALLLKTWRVSLTYRVKSAHKIKLTDKQLLQWLFPILLVMAIYLGAWTISDTPQAVYIVDWNNLKYKQCDYNWWDHSLLIGEFFFLLWGIKVCYNVRNAESLFNEAKYITWAIYNITLVNIIMILLHLSILPNSGPDIKYFFGFVRTQLSTTTTVILIFGPKFYRVIKGQGDLWDTQIRARGIAASFSFNGVGLAHEETTDLYQENEELKEEIQKLAAQLEIMKICQMEFKNRHLKFSKQHQQANSD